MSTTTMYNAEVEVDRKPLRTDDELDRAMDRLATFHPALSGSRRGYATARISLPAETLAQACTAAAAVVEAAFGATAIACEVMTEAEFLAREGWEPVDESDVLSVGDAAELLKVSRQRVLQLIAAKALPSNPVGRTHAIPRAAVLARLQRQTGEN